MKGHPKVFMPKTYFNKNHVLTLKKPIRTGGAVAEWHDEAFNQKKAKSKKIDNCCT